MTKMKRPLAVTLLLLVALVALWRVDSHAVPQQQVSGGGSVVLQAGSNLVGKMGIDQTTPGTTNKVDIGTNGTVTANAGTGTFNIQANASINNAQINGAALLAGNGVTGTGSQRVTIASDNTPFQIISIPAGCGGTTIVVHDTVGVATGAGTSVSAVTGCVIAAYANNITNSAVTLRIADKTGTPIIWMGGNADFSIPANSNIALPIPGITMTSGITAIAGTASAINLHLVTKE